MSDKPRRAWFQIHLSTAIVMMFVAGTTLHWLIPFFERERTPPPTDLPWDLTGSTFEFGVSLAQDTSGYTVQLQDRGDDRFDKYDLVVYNMNSVELFRQKVQSWTYTPYFIQNDVLYYPQYEYARTGCSVIAFDLKKGRELWRNELFGIGAVSHSKYRNRVYCRIESKTMIVYGDEAYGQYVEVLDLNSGETLGNRGFHNSINFEMREFIQTFLLALLGTVAAGALSETAIRFKKATP